MPANYVLIREVTLNASAASVTFSGIPQTGYTDLVIKVSARCDTTGYYGGGYQQAIYARFNSSTTSYSNRFLQAEGNGSVNSGTGYFTSGTTYAAVGTIDPSDWTANTFSNIELYIPNYTSSNNKSYSVDGVAENNGTFGSNIMIAGLWSSSSSISSIVFSLPNGNFTANTTISLYGIAAVGATPTVVPAASGGDIVTNDGTYWYHAFLASGTFIPNKVNLSCDVLVVAGGGGGAGYGGGGGAGGLLGFTSQALTLGTAYSCVVGAGGVKTPYNTANIGLGNNSQFGSLTAAVGGGGGGSATNYRTGGNGGSGGGGGSADPGNGTASGGTATSGQGYAGGSGTSQTSAHGGGGGGGAGAVGATTTGIGGVGSSAYSSWGGVTGTGQNVSSTYYFAGGGTGHGDTLGPNAGGYGGGGSGGYGSSGTAGTANTGGGGGSWQGDGGNGGSGIVIVRYAMAQ